MNKIFFYFLVILFMYSCNVDNCSKNLGFKLDYHLFEYIKVDGDTYCELINKSLKKDSKAILKLSKITLNDGVSSYQHGAVLLEVIDKLGELRYCEIIDKMSEKEKRKVYYAILAGLDYTENPKYFGKKIEDVFPKLRKLLNSP